MPKKTYRKKTRPNQAKRLRSKSSSRTKKFTQKQIATYVNLVLEKRGSNEE